MADLRFKNEMDYEGITATTATTKLKMKQQSADRSHIMHT